MCTLTYRLTELGYELFFNRDEQRSRAQAIPPKIDTVLNAIYPVDPIGGGTWLAVHQNGVSLALLNYYQAEKKPQEGPFISRGEIIIKLLEDPTNIIVNIKKLALDSYQAFQLCVFPSDLTLSNNQVPCFQWDGESLTEQSQTLPITSSGVDYPQVYEARKASFQQITTAGKPTVEQLLEFHEYQQDDGKLSVKMFREDAKTVSFSHISISESIKFQYMDYLDNKKHFSAL